MRQLCLSTCLVRLSILTSMTARLRELDTSTPARVSTPVTSAAITDSMRASSPDGNAPPSGRSVMRSHKMPI